LIDIAANLTNRQFERDRDAVIRRAVEAGVTTMVVLGTSVEESRQALALSQGYSNLIATAGIHPHDAKTADEHSLADLRQLLDQPQVRAVGECGLDFNRDFSPRPVQLEVLEMQLQLAAETGMPLMLHERDASEALLALLKIYRAKLAEVVLHCFTGNADELKAYLDLDLHIGITGWICDERRGRHLIDLLPEIPHNRLMLETDSPYLLPRDLLPKPRSRRNEPAFLFHILQRVANYRGESVETLSRNVVQTTRRFFGLDTWVE
jgi:TatD DNase family protein